MLDSDVALCYLSGMKMHKWFKSASTDEKRRVAEKLGTSVPYLYQLATMRRRPSAEFAVQIETATGGKVTRADLRPDLWSGNAA